MAIIEVYIISFIIKIIYFEDFCGRKVHKIEWKDYCETFPIITIYTNKKSPQSNLAVHLLSVLPLECLFSFELNACVWCLLWKLLQGNLLISVTHISLIL